MIAPEFGFSFNNYVGTYKIIKHEGDEVIVSNEYHPARNGEPELQTKTLFLDDFKDNEFLLVDLANVDITKDSSILSFCNKYGLPYSSAKINDQHPGYFILGLDVSEVQYAQWDPYYRQDTMSKYEFCRHASSAKRLISVKTELEAKSKNPHTLLESLLPLMLYERKHLYDFNDDDLDRHTPTTEFQYYFLQVLHKIGDKNPLNKPILDFFNFVVDTQSIEKNTNKVPINDKLRLLLSSDYANKLYKVIILFMQCDTEYLNEIVMDDFLNIQIPNELALSNDLIDLIYGVAPIILSDTINEGMHLVHPKSVVNENGTFTVDWEFSFLFEEFEMELLLMLSSNNFHKKCANPSCEKFFTPTKGHFDKMYCSRECGVAAAKRRQRQRDKENPNRERLPAGFQKRQKE